MHNKISFIVLSLIMLNLIAADTIDKTLALQHATEQFLADITDQTARKDSALAILKTAKFFTIESIMQAAAQSVADYLKTPDALDQFNKDPQQFVNKVIALGPEQQKIVSVALLKPYEDQLTKVELRNTLQGHTGSVLTASYSPSGDSLVSRSADNTIKLWNPQTGQLTSTFQIGTASVVYHPKDNQCASASGGGTIKVRNSKTGNLMHILKGHTSSVLALAYSPSGGQLASASLDSTIKLWDPKTGMLLRTLRGHINAVIALAYSPSGDQLASAEADLMGFAPYDGTIKLWNPQNGKLIHTLRGHTDKVNKIAYSPDGNQLASASQDHTIKIWNPQTGQLIYTFEGPQGHTRSVNSIAYSPSGDQLASASYDNTIKLWNLQNGKLIHTFESSQGHTRPVNSVSYNSSGDQLASASDDTTIKLWSIPLDFNQLIKSIDLAQAIYIYETLRIKEQNKTISVSNKTAAYFKKLHASLPKNIKLRLSRGTNSCATR